MGHFRATDRECFGVVVWTAGMSTGHATVGGGLLTIGDSADTKPTESAMQLSLDECIRALTLAPGHDPEADTNGARLFRTVLIDAPGVLNRNELEVLIALVQRIALRRGWMIGTRF